MQKTQTNRLVKTALLIALSTILSMFQPFSLPFGGGITIFSMLPIVLIAYIYGTKWGLFSAFVGALLQMLTGFKTVSAMFLPGDGQMLIWQAILICLIDYIIAYTVLGFGGIFRNKMSAPKALCLGSIVAVSLRFLAHFTSGYVFFGAYAEWFFSQETLGSFGVSILENMSGQGLALFYSFFYNGTYMIPEIIMTAVAGMIIARVPQLVKKEDNI